MIKVCPSCSKVDIDVLKENVPAGKLYIGCVGLCRQYSGMSFGYINGKLVVKDSSNKFIEEVKLANKPIAI